MQKPAVLMLGWEFPPQISGGLGVATYNLCKALAPRTKLTVVLPKADDEFRIPDVRIIDLSKIKLQKTFEKQELKHFKKILKEKNIAFRFSPYPVKAVQEMIRRSDVQEKVTSEHIEEIHNKFASSDLYGMDVVDKVNYYTELVIHVIKGLSFDVIHAHDWMTSMAGIRLKEIYKKPLVLHIHSLNYDRIGPDKMDWVYKLEKKALRSANLVIPVSQYTGNIIREFYRISGKKIFPVYNGIEKAKPFKSQKNFPEKLVLFMGRITFQKGPEYFLEAATRIYEQYENVRFAVAGEGDKLQEILASGAYSELNGKMHFTGFLKRQEVNYILSVSDVFCMPSVSEPFGLTAFEAVQFGIPVVISKKSGAAEVLKGALLVDFWDTQKMADLIIELLTNKKLYKRCVKQGYEDLKELTWEKSAMKILTIYEKLTVKDKQ